MSWLRWILLLAGLLFIAALAWREVRRGRQDVAAGDRRPRRDDPPLDIPAAATAINAESHGDVSEAAAAWVVAPMAARHKSDAPLPVVEMNASQMAAISLGDLETVTEVDVHTLISNGEAAAPAHDATATTSEHSATPRAVELPPQPVPSIAEWPPEEQRRICSLRLTPLRQERFSGRSLRQGLQSAGFQHGELGIFHLPGAAGRAMMSVANLKRPGQLDPEMMDYQRFAGLHLFTVLPGRVSNRMALQQLFALSQQLALRLDGVVQDVHGKALDAGRMADLQRQFADDISTETDEFSAVAARE
jgi:FtsZ-interacting cell division protein ZipA